MLFSKVVCATVFVYQWRECHSERYSILHTWWIHTGDCADVDGTDRGAIQQSGLLTTSDRCLDLWHHSPKHWSNSGHFLCQVSSFPWFPTSSCLYLMPSSMQHKSENPCPCGNHTFLNEMVGWRQKTRGLRHFALCTRQNAEGRVLSGSSHALTSQRCDYCMDTGFCFYLATYIFKE